MTITVEDIKVTEHFTQPPKHYTEDSLLSAMERAGAEDMGDEVERKGLGTPATRADIIEKLVKDGFVKREKKQMIPTEDGMKLITVLPDVVKSPKLTADWENELTLVSQGKVSADQFMEGIESMVRELVKTYHSVSDEQKNMFVRSNTAEKLEICPKCGGDVVKGKFGAYCKKKCGMNEQNKPLDKEQFSITIGGKAYTDKKEARTAIIAMCKEIRGINASADVGEYLGFKLNVTFDSFNNKFVMNVKGAMSHPMEVGADPLGNITRQQCIGSNAGTA